MQTLNATLANVPQDEIILDSELDSLSFSPKSHRKYAGKLRLLSHVHLAIKDQLNARRKAVADEFFALEDRYIPETQDSCDLVALHFASMKHAN